ncbi:GyrI-like domain-containing protein [Niveibacterium sp. COAC-50]|uniref:AraC family transcriptional regulator n=1 Tax=Niveibacterium sp. COAC-50 TaxID=2729384 RepID=UPI0015533ED7|nr:AraC family transcriptional regulator [Niveibacterium sp. COAC-50]
MTSTLDSHALVGSHARRLNRVIDHVEAHLADDLRLDHLARLAAYSPFHLHRVFRAWTGETLRDFVRRRRLETAGIRLRYDPALTVREVAVTCGFASAETFARAFRQHFGVTPSAWRQSALQRPPQHRVTGGPDRDAATPTLGKVTLQQLPQREVLYWRVQGDYSDVVAPLWVRFKPWVHALGLGDQPMLGMGLDDPAIAPPQHCRYDACVVLPPGWQESAQLRPSRKRVEGGWHACVRFEGPRADIGLAWSWLIDQWLPQSGFIAASGPFFETYAAGHPSDGNDDLVAELCMPVLPLGR